MPTFFVKNLTHPIASVDGAGTVVNAPIDSAASAVTTYAALPGAIVSPGDVFRVIPTNRAAYVVAQATLTYPDAPAPALPAVGT